jgi:hypothetical protein
MSLKRRRAQDRVAELVANYMDGLVTALREELRQEFAAEVTGFLGQGRGQARALNLNGTMRKRGKARPCIAPGCNNPSKGPRFRFLCDEHKGAPKSDYEAWRANGAAAKKTEPKKRTAAKRSAKKVTPKKAKAKGTKKKAASEKASEKTESKTE